MPASDRRTHLPEFVGCTSCGECCTVVRARPDEAKRIRRYAEDNDVEWIVDNNVQPDPIPGAPGLNRTCGFLRKEADGKFACAAYPVRPWTCRAFGVLSHIPCAYFPENAQLVLPAPEIEKRGFSRHEDKWLGEYFEPGYKDRMAAYLAATSEEAFIEYVANKVTNAVRGFDPTLKVEGVNLHHAE